MQFAHNRVLQVPCLGDGYQGHSKLGFPRISFTNTLVGRFNCPAGLG